MDKIRLANPQEIAEIQQTADLGPTTTVVAFENGKTGISDTAVIRLATEIDPLHIADGSERRKVQFMWALETSLRLQGVPAVYFNVRADDTRWHEILRHWGAETVSPSPELRFKKVL